MKRLVVTLFVSSAFAPAVFAQTTKQKETVIPNCVEIIRGTQRQCENVITPGAVQMGEKVLSSKEGGKAQVKRLTPEQSKASKARAVRLLEIVSGRQIRDFEDGPDGPIISVAR